MVISFLLGSISLKYLRKAFAYCALLGLLSCKDFKNWEGTYASKVKISLSTEKDALISNQLEDLQSIKIQALINNGKLISSVDNKPIDGYCSSFFVPLNPNADSVIFELGSTDRYYQKITLHYQRTCSLISPEAGGMQVKYGIERVELHPNDKTDTRRPIFKQFAIERAVPLKEEDQSHVTLYY